MKSLSDWIEHDLNELKKIPQSDYNNVVFNRDPIRNVILDNGLFFAPADGTVLYATEVGGDDQILDIKGKQFCLRDLMQQEVNFRALVIGIFLSQYDVHIARIPYGGFFYYKKLDKITTTNRPMVLEEKDIFEGLIDPEHEDYAFTNERYLWEVHVPRTGYKYYMIAIADKEVDVIAHHYESGKFLSQNTRTATIKYGSQINLILPLMPGIKFELIVSRGWHVEAGNDPIVRISKSVVESTVKKRLDFLVEQIDRALIVEIPVDKTWQLKSGIWHDYDKNGLK